MTGGTQGTFPQESLGPHQRNNWLLNKGWGARPMLDSRRAKHQPESKRADGGKKKSERRVPQVGEKTSPQLSCGNHRPSTIHAAGKTKTVRTHKMTAVRTDKTVGLHPHSHGLDPRTVALQTKAGEVHPWSRLRSLARTTKMKWQLGRPRGWCRSSMEEEARMMS